MEGNWDEITTFYDLMTGYRVFLELDLNQTLKLTEEKAKEMGL